MMKDEPNTQYQSKSVRILDMIAVSDGMRFTDIQRALWYMSHARAFTREVRGYWCTNLLGVEWTGLRGLLRTFCVKGPDGLWRRNDVPHSGHPFAAIRGNSV